MNPFKAKNISLFDIELKKCPFCGSNAILSFNKETKFYNVQCLRISCGAKVGDSYLRENVIQMWSNRVSKL